MKGTELTKTFIMMSNWKKTFGRHGTDVGFRAPTQEDPAKTGDPSHEKSYH